MAGGRCIKIHKPVSVCIINCEDPARKASTAPLHIALPGRECALARYANSYIIARAEIRSPSLHRAHRGVVTPSTRTTINGSVCKFKYRKIHPFVKRREGLTTLTHANFLNAALLEQECKKRLCARRTSPSRRLKVEATGQFLLFSWSTCVCYLIFGL